MFFVEETFAWFVLLAFAKVIYFICRFIFDIFLLSFFYISFLFFYFCFDWKSMNIKSVYSIFNDFIGLVIGEMKFYNFLKLLDIFIKYRGLFLYFFCLIDSPSTILSFFFFSFFFRFNSPDIKRALFLGNFKKNAIIAGLGIRQQGIFYLNVWILNTRYELQIHKGEYLLDHK